MSHSMLFSASKTKIVNLEILSTNNTIFFRRRNTRIQFTYILLRNNNKVTLETLEYWNGEPFTVHSASVTIFVHSLRHEQRLNREMFITLDKCIGKNADGRETKW